MYVLCKNGFYIPTVLKSEYIFSGIVHTGRHRYILFQQQQKILDWINLQSLYSERWDWRNETITEYNIIAQLTMCVDIGRCRERGLYELYKYIFFFHTKCFQANIPQLKTNCASNSLLEKRGIYTVRTYTTRLYHYTSYRVGHMNLEGCLFFRSYLESYIDTVKICAGFIMKMEV